jgi:integrase
MSLVLVEASEESNLAAAEARHRLDEQASALGRAAKADATRIAYASDLRDFTVFCNRHEESAFPAMPQTVARYIAHLQAEHIGISRKEEIEVVPPCSVSTIARRMVAIAQAHKKAKLPNPVADPCVREIVQGLRREKGVAQKKKDPITLDHLRAALATIDTATLKGKRDKALLLLGFALAGRRSEIAQLNVEDLRFDTRGLRVTIRRSKTDQTGKGCPLGVPYVGDEELCAVRAVQAWLDASGIREGALFRTFDGGKKLTMNRIDPKDVTRLVKRVTGKAEIDGDFSGHSLRAGFITEASSTQGVAEYDIQRVSRHKNTDIMRDYMREANIFKNAPLSMMLG